MQERRIRAKKNKELRDPTAGAALKGSSTNGASVNGSVGAVHGSTRAIKLDPSLAPMLEDETSGKGVDVLSTLSSEQIQQFESENSALLQSFQNDLADVQQAESKLYAISELQTQLLQHLGQQAEMTDRLLEESVNHTSEVGQGNTQLRKAKERSREANKFLSIFLVGSGLGLLFLHCELPPDKCCEAHLTQLRCSQGWTRA
jgi:syntaxin 18